MLPLVKQLGNREQRLQVYEFQSNAFDKDVVVPQADHTAEIQQLLKTLHNHRRSQERKLEETKKMFRESIDGLMTSDRLKDSLRQQVRLQMTMEIRHECSLYLQERMPVAPETRLEETKKELERTKIELLNSQARTRNASILKQDLDEPLEPVLTTNGKRSSLYPADLRSLLSYEAKDLSALLDDYDLNESENRDESLESFMEFIGIR